MILQVATDCSGLDAPLFALDNLKIPYEYKFACDIDKYVRKTIQANHKPGIIYEDIRTVRSLPKLDLYIAGFPCQPFSNIGKKLGPKDTRSDIFQYVLKTIKDTDTEMFILENVKTIRGYKEYYESIITRLKSLGYTIHADIYNSSDYGIPQNRERLYIIGHKSEYSYKIPSKLPICPYYIDQFDNETELSKTNKLRLNKILNIDKLTFINLSNIYTNSKSHNYSTNCNTITKQAYVYCIPKKRVATMNEILSLQGLPHTFIQVVSDTQLRYQIGNSMSVNVLESILKELYLREKLLDC